jgi:chorismate synthase
VLRFLTAGESHGPWLTAIVEGLPAGLTVDLAAINRDLRRRQGGYGRGGRMEIEQDHIEVLGGILYGRTTGAPVALHIENKDWANWRDRWASGDLPEITVPRPGHADYAGMVKYGLEDARLIAERASARETAARVAVGALTKQLLRHFDITVGSYVTEIGGVTAKVPQIPPEQLWSRVEASDVRCPDQDAAARMTRRIDEARRAGDSLGGVFVVMAIGVPIGLGSHTHWDRRLDARLIWAVTSIPAIKGAEVGPAFENARKPGTKVHDEFAMTDRGVSRRSNRAGGLEGGMTNGMPVIVRAAMKPIPTTVTPLRSVDLETGEPAETEYQRSDVCAVPAASIVGEAMVAWVLADALLEKLGGDSLEEMKAHAKESWPKPSS